MGVLYARVDGAWVPVIAPAPAPVDEVWVGPSAPAASETELWVDSDLTPAPMLFAKIGGNWTQVSAPPTNEVAVQTDAPAVGGTEELWYDSDALGYTPDDLRWLSAWGVLGMAKITANQTGFTSAAAPGQEISGLGLTANVIAGRRYRISCDVAVYGDQANIQVNFVLRLNRTYTMQMCNYPIPLAGWGNRNYMELHYAPATSAAETWTVNVFRTAGAGNFACNASTDQPMQLVIEDVGPATGTAIPSQIVTPWTAMTLNTGWSSMSSWQPAQYRKVGDEVQLRGLITNAGSNATIWTPIPTGFGPPVQCIYSAPYATPTGPHAAGRIDVYPTFMNGVAPVNYLSLNGISWSVT